MEAPRDTTHVRLSRRSLLALGASGLAGSVAPGSVEPARAQSADDIVRSEYTATKPGKGGPVSLALYRKVRGGTRPGRPVLFLVHGSSISALPSYDLALPGRGEYSLMNVFARMDFDVWTVDHENYGSRPARRATPTSRAAPTTSVPRRRSSRGRRASPDSASSGSRPGR